MNQTFILREMSAPGNRDAARDRFVIEGRWSSVPPNGAASTLANGLYLVPPLVDSHAHVTVEPGPDGAASWLESAHISDAERRRRALANLGKNLALGVLAIRDAGAASGVLSSLGDTGPDPLPNLQSSARIVTGPGRHFAGVADEVVGAELALAADREAARSGGWIKLVADAPHRDRPGSPAETDWQLEDVQAAVAAASRHGARTIFHALTPEVARIGLRAGVHSIEHGWGLTPDDLPEMARVGTAWTPTARGLLDAVAGAHGAGTRAPAFIEDGLDRVRMLVPVARSSGVRVLLGTDLAVAHGAIVRELLALVELGMTPVDAVGAATTDSWSFLGLPDFGTPGEPADFLLLDRDPLEDPGALARPSVVVRAGQVVSDRRAAVL